MYEFLLLALVVLYLAVSYAPTSQAPKDTSEIKGSEQSSGTNSDIDPATRG
jgi:hypothetical protein